MNNEQLISSWREQFNGLFGIVSIKNTLPSVEQNWLLSHLNTAIDHTLLKSNATSSDIEKLCKEAEEHGFASVCIYPSWVPHATSLLNNSEVKVCTVVGFPHGNSSTEIKSHETKKAVEDGACEIDMVIQLGALKSRDFQTVLTDIKNVVTAADPHLVKVIIETSALNQEEKIQACLLAEHAGAHFVKTSTGFGEHGAKVADVELMAEVVGRTMGIKASGGIRTLEAAKNMVMAGATRLGTSASVDITSGLS